MRAGDEAVLDELVPFLEGQKLEAGEHDSFFQPSQSDTTATLSQWVGVTTQKTPGAVSTIVLTKVADPGQGFAELDRLLALARQK